jgi:hypothetical protein
MKIHILSLWLTYADDPAAQYVESRPIAESPAEPSHLKRCLKQYKRCLNHEGCKAAIKRNKNDTVPTRLLDVRSKSRVCLFTVPAGEAPLYAALSYCWGKSEQQMKATTTTKNIQNQHLGIDISHLPQSIRDGIQITRLLKLPYIWVDALCIVQDDPKDFASEIPKMTNMYRGATITIAAASAKDSTEGFLGTRNLGKAYGRLFRLPYYNKRDGNVAKGSVLLCEQRMADNYQEEIDERAWTMQEDILSPRLLRFGSKQTTWRCPKYDRAIRIDGGRRPVFENQDRSFAVDAPYQVSDIQSRISAYPQFGFSSVMESWLQTVSRYTNRKLTNTNDRLPACAALAETLAAILGLEASQYLAGLWQDDIQAQLLWYRPEGSKSERSSGPSWSWASVSGPVEFPMRKLLEEGLVVKAEAKYISSGMDYESNEYRYAGVRSGRLELEGRLRRAYWDSESIRQSIDYGNALPFKILWDVSESDYPQNVWCFEIIGSNPWLGLVLVTEDQTYFQRVGCYEGIVESSMLLLSYFNEVEPRTITIY